MHSPHGRHPFHPRLLSQNSITSLVGDPSVADLKHTARIFLVTLANYPLKACFPLGHRLPHHRFFPVLCNWNSGLSANNDNQNGWPTLSDSIAIRSNEAAGNKAARKQHAPNRTALGEHIRFSPLPECGQLTRRSLQWWSGKTVSKYRKHREKSRVCVSTVITTWRCTVLIASWQDA